MKETSEPALVVPKPGRRKVSGTLNAFLAICAFLLAVALFIPVLDGPHSRQVANEAVAVSKLLAVNTLQSKYSIAHPQTGFACELPILKSTEPLEDPNYDPMHFLTTGTQSGYKFALGICYPDAKGVVVHYKVSAVPIELGVTGFQAFCIDESGVIWHDKDGSVKDCLAARRPLE